MKNFKRIISAVLVIVLCFSMCITAFAAEDKLNYVVLGDSIAQGLGLVNFEQAAYGKIIADTNGYNYVNHAIGGHTTKNLLNRLGEDAVKEDVANADIISISIGGNDFLTNNLYGLIIEGGIIGNYETFDAIADEFYERFSKIISEIKVLNADAVILVQNLYNPRSDALRDIYQQAVDRLNAGYERYLEENPGSYVIIDVESAFGDNEEYICFDMIHPSAAGNELIAKLTAEKLYELGIGETTELVITTPGEDAEYFFYAFMNAILGMFGVLIRIAEYFR